MKRIVLLIMVAMTCRFGYSQDAVLSQRIDALEKRLQNLEQAFGIVKEMREGYYLGEPKTSFVEDNIKFDVMSAEMNENTGEIRIAIQVLNQGLDKNFKLDYYYFLDTKQNKQSKSGYEAVIKGSNNSPGSSFRLTKNDPITIYLNFTDPELPEYVKNLRLVFNTYMVNSSSNKKFEGQFKDFPIERK